MLKISDPPEIIKGKWINGILHGLGSRQLINEQELYEGEFIDGKLNGRGKMTSKTCWYEGFFRNNLEHGKGLKVYSNGNKYRGMWADGYPDGHGVFTWADGGEYQGIFRNGMKEG